VLEILKHDKIIQNLGGESSPVIYTHALAAKPRDDGIVIDRVGLVNHRSGIVYSRQCHRHRVE